LVALAVLFAAIIAPASAQVRVLRMALPGSDVLSLDPQGFCCRGQREVLFPASDAQVLAQIYEGLVRYDPQTLQPVPALAESWDISPDGLVYTFHLRAATFHNGDRFVAGDVVNSLNRLADPPDGIVPGPSFAGPLIVRNIAGYEEVLDGLTFALSGVKAIDERTVEITLGAPNTALLSLLAMPPAAIVPLEQAVDPTTFSGSAVGTGPFMVEEWVRQVQITLVRNPNYWGPAPALDRVVMRVLPDRSMALGEFMAGHLEIAFLLPADAARLSTEPPSQSRVQKQTILSLFWLPLNLNSPPLDNVQVRQAMSMAIDRQAIVDGVLQGLGTPAHGPIPPGLLAYDPSYNPFPYNPVGARELLTAAGYPDGIDVEFRTWTDQPENPVFGAVQEQWAQVGIRSSFYNSDYNALASDMAQCSIMIGAGSWTGNYADPDDYFLPLPLTGNNPMGANCGYGQFPEVERLAQEALLLPVGPERDVLYREAERVAVENVLGIFLYHRGAAMVMNERVRGAYLDGFGNVRLESVSLEG
jgi:ABC-type transport system substrate-binding protein